MTALCVKAETITGIALTDFSTANPKSTFTVKTNEGFSVNNLYYYKPGTIFHGRVIKVVNGQIGKRKGYFVFQPTHTLKYEEWANVERDMYIKVSFYKPFDKKQAAKNLANIGLTTAAGKILHVPVLSQGISFVKGVKNAENGERIVSGVKQVYEDSPLSYVEKGDEFKVTEGQEVKLTIGMDSED